MLVEACQDHLTVTSSLSQLSDQRRTEVRLWSHSYILKKKYYSEENHVCFVLTSKILDFIIVESDVNTMPDSIIILAEEEIVFIDLVTRGWPEWQAPYLTSLHASAITCLSHQSELDPGVLETLEQMSAGSTDHGRGSRRQWPVCGGECDQLPGDKPSLIITGEC